MKVALLIAVMLATDVLMEVWVSRRRYPGMTESSSGGSVSARRRRRLSGKKEVTAAEDISLAEKLDLLQDAADTLEEAVEAMGVGPPGVAMREPQKMEWANGNLDEGETFDILEKKDEVEEDAALGLVKEELEALEDLEEDLEEELDEIQADATE